MRKITLILTLLVLTLTSSSLLGQSKKINNKMLEGKIWEGIQRGIFPNNQYVHTYYIYTKDSVKYYRLDLESGALKFFDKSAYYVGNEIDKGFNSSLVGNSKSGNYIIMQNYNRNASISWIVSNIDKNSHSLYNECTYDDGKVVNTFHSTKKFTALSDERVKEVKFDNVKIVIGANKKKRVYKKSTIEPRIEFQKNMVADVELIIAGKKTDGEIYKKLCNKQTGEFDLVRAKKLRESLNEQIDKDIELLKIAE